MLTGKSTPATETRCVSRLLFGALLCAMAHIAPAAGADSAEALADRAPLSDYSRETRSGASAPAPRTVRFVEVHPLIDDPAHGSFDGSAAQPAAVTAGASNCIRAHARALAALCSIAGSPRGLASIDSSRSDLLARLHRAFGSDSGLPSDRARQDEREVLLRNSDAVVRAKLRLSMGKGWPGFVYADMGATDSALKWQGLAGVHGGHGVDLLAGWRHVTYHFSPGAGLDSLDFNGPFLGATLAW